MLLTHTLNIRGEIIVSLNTILFLPSTSMELDSIFLDRICTPTHSELHLQCISLKYILVRGKVSSGWMSHSKKSMRNSPFIQKVEGWKSRLKSMIEVNNLNCGHSYDSKICTFVLHLGSQWGIRFLKWYLRRTGNLLLFPVSVFLKLYS